MRIPRLTRWLATIALVSQASVAAAQTETPLPKPPEPRVEASTPADDILTRPAWKALFTDTLVDFRRFPSRETAWWLTAGTGAAVLTHPADQTVDRSLSRSLLLHETTESGAWLGSTPFQLGAALATYFVGRSTDSPRVASVGADLVRGQILAETITFAMKQSFQRDRPQGSGYSFPSGHTSATFTSATVLQQHFGWKVGIPAYAVASYVAVSRVQNRNHYLSDVAFGAALGIAVGRTVTIGQRHRFMLEATPTPGGAALSFTLQPKK
jgi:membrane-associated phospholipid phosphatase